MIRITLPMGKVLALRQLPAAMSTWSMHSGAIDKPSSWAIAAVSVGIYAGEPVLDLDYVEDSGAETDMNVVMNEIGGYVEIQGTAEGHAFRHEELEQMLLLANHGIKQLIEIQRKTLRSP